MSVATVDMGTKLYNAFYMVDYEVHWSITTVSEEKRTEAIKAFALREWAREDANEFYPEGWAMEGVAEEPGFFLDERDGGVIVTDETELQ